MMKDEIDCHSSCNSFLSFALSSSSLSFNLRRHHFVVIICVISNVGVIEGIIVVTLRHQRYLHVVVCGVLFN